MFNSDLAIGNAYVSNAQIYFGNTGIRYLQLNSTGFRFATAPLAIDNNLSVGGITSLSDALTGTSAMFNGNVGIGTTSPSEKLSVNGNIRSKKLIITQTNWSDYVFDSSYQLQPLTEVEQFIKTHKHLPDIPSAKEVEKEGLDVGENQAVLLRKIEELTLYMIETNKKMEQMKKEMSALKKQNEQMIAERNCHKNWVKTPNG